jgi:hypothetical protein
MNVKQPLRNGARGKAAFAGSSALKYDVLTSLLSLAAAGQGTEQRLAMRLTLLITARYNWRRGTFNVGQREIARMWNVTERTAKREMAALRKLGWIAITIPPARGRVAEYEIVFPAVFATTRPHWAAIGPDFEARMTQSESVPLENPAADNVVPLHVTLPVDRTGAVWPAAAAFLEKQDPALFAAWFAQLEEDSIDVGHLTLTAPSKFIAGYVETHFKTRLLSAVSQINRGIREIRVVAVRE